MKNVACNFQPSGCCGCGACMQACPVGAIRMGEDSFGFSIPIVDKSACVSCGKCIAVCPFREPPHVNRLPQPDVFAALHRDRKVVMASTSGGIFTALAGWILGQNGIVFGAEMKNDFRVAHTWIDDAEDLPRFQKSKYVQSDMGDCYRRAARFLKDGRKVLFSGTPCQVAGLLRYLGSPLLGDLTTVEVVCHGVPSQRLFDDYRTCLEAQVGRIDKYVFRCKGQADFGMKWYVGHQTATRKWMRNWPEDSYAYFYMKGLSYRESCYRCPFAQPNRFADVTLCDYWHWPTAHPQAFRMNATVSGVLANTQRGRLLLEKVSPDVDFVKSDFRQLAAHNSCLLRPVGGDVAMRTKILKTWIEKGYSFLDAQFRQKQRWQIAKYRIIRLLPDWIFFLGRRVKHGH